MVDLILESLDLEHLIPPKRLQSSVNLLSVILEKCGRLMGERLLSYLLRVLLCISAVVQGALACRDVVHPGYLTTLLSLRNSCQGIAARFFEHFDNYAWSEVEVDTLFRILVWPWLEKLPVEGIHSPTALLKLFLVWSKHPRYSDVMLYSQGASAVLSNMFVCDPMLPSWLKLIFPCSGLFCGIRWFDTDCLWVPSSRVKLTLEDGTDR